MACHYRSCNIAVALSTTARLSVKEGIRLGLSRRDAVSRVVKFCLEHSEEFFNILALE